MSRSRLADDIRGEELRLQGCRFVVPAEQTPEMVIDERLDDALEAIDAALLLLDTTDPENELLLCQAVTLISRVQRRLT